MNTNNLATSRANDLLILNHDILLIILYHCLSPDIPIEIPPLPTTPHLVLGHVCHKIRWLLHTTPSFWTRFSITRTLQNEDRRELLKGWLRRAESYTTSPLISIENTSMSVFSLHDLRDFILPEAHRLHRLHLCLSYEATEGLFTHSSIGIFPHLVDFCVQCIEAQEPAIVNVEPIFRMAPLRKFALVLGPPVNVRGLEIPWINLHTLSLSATPDARFYFPISWIHMILSEAEGALVNATLAVEPTTEPELTRLTLPHLTSLSLQFREAEWKTQAAILACLSLPKLENLEFCSPVGLVFNEVSPTLRAFLLRSPCLQKLIFERVPLPSHRAQGQSTTVDSFELQRVLTLLPCLRHVHLPRGTHTHLTHFLLPLVRGQLCPSLEHIDMALSGDIFHVLETIYNHCSGHNTSAYDRDVATAGGKGGDLTIRLRDVTSPIVDLFPGDENRAARARMMIEGLALKGIHIRT